jgi:transglutaminase-like putative cysteine protease
MKWLTRPAEGWLAPVLVVVMAVAIGWALDGPGWVLGNKGWTDFLPFAAVAGVTVGFVGAKVRWPLWIVHLVGAAFAALILPVVVGSIDHPGISLGAAFQATADAAVQAWRDIAIEREAVTGQTLHHLLAFGILAWGTGQAMSYAVFGHRRPLDAVVVGGLLLIVNMSVTRSDQLPYLVIFTAASLFLLVTMHALDERLTWIRRRIGDPSTISSLYLRGGTVFIALAIAGSLVLTTQASSAPLRGMLSGATRFLVDISEDLQGLLPGGGDQKPGPVSFRGRAQISGQWTLSEEVAFTARPPATVTDLYYRAGAWDVFVYPNTWDQSEAGQTKVPVSPDEAITAHLDPDEIPAEDKSRSVEIDISPVSYVDGLALGPGVYESINRPATVATLGEGRHYQGVEVGEGPYTVTTIIWVPGPGSQDFNAAALRSASDEYPQEIIDLYTRGWEQSIPEGGKAWLLRDVIRAEAASGDPYDVAAAFERAFRDPKRFDYNPDVRSLQCDRIGIVECLAEHREGYCMHYATSMALMLRSLGIPARIAQGFLPGDRAGGIETIRNQNAHAWVEVYFPGYGWQPFDPTGGPPRSAPQGGGLVPGPSAAPGASASATVRPSGSRRESVLPSRLEPGDEGFGGTVGRPSSPAVFIVVTILLVLAVGTLAAVAWWRGPRGEVTPDLAWRTIGRLAGRFGFAPRPTQTVYEFAGSLGEVIPVAREDLQTVARAKVEVVYGRTTLSKDRMRTLREANRRLRVTLLRLLFRRRRRRGVRGIRGLRS